MKQVVLTETLIVDDNRQLHIKIPDDMGDEFEVILIPTQKKPSILPTNEEQFMLSVYSNSIEMDNEEDAIWEHYVAK